MKQREIFSDAKWLRFSPTPVSVDACFDFEAHDCKEAKLYIIGLGFFECTLNGEPVSDRLFLPLNSDFHKRPSLFDGKEYSDDTRHRMYVSEFELTGVNEGKNRLGISLGGGWYDRGNDRESFGDKKFIFRLTLKDGSGELKELLSGHNVRWQPGFIKDYSFTRGQRQDFRGYEDGWRKPDFDVSSWKKAKLTADIDTEYCFTDCPADKVLESISPVLIDEENGVQTYDIGRNCSGVVRLRLTGEAGSRVLVRVGEEKTEDNRLDKNLIWEQTTEYISDGKSREVFTKFTWNAGRYFDIKGKAELIDFLVIHTDVAVNSSFESDNATLKWIYDAYINTQLSNMHSGIPSDCPHIERRGYTGDGQLAANAAMTALDAKSFYRKWIDDIADCQDSVSGHVQYTAPYVRSGGGPGGWGCAIVHVPYEYYKHYGDISPMRDMYEGMLKYFSFLDSHSERNLVRRDVPGEWCLGDWCTPQEMLLPTPFVNNYFYIKSINEILELKEPLELSRYEVKRLEEKRAVLIQAFTDGYYDDVTGDFAGNVQGANAFAIDLGLGDSRTFENMTAAYEKRGMYDTGIFGTDILTRVLFSNGRGDLAYRLLTSDKKYSFENIRRQGATTLWEYWTGERSHSHPMFGAVTAYLFEYLLGIRNQKGSYAMAAPVIAPVYPGCDARFSGSLTAPCGKFSADIKYEGKKAMFKLSSPVDFEFIFKNDRRALQAGEHSIEIEL